MSVPKSQRSTTLAEYIIAAEDLRKTVLPIARKLPKRWSEDLVRSLNTISAELILNCYLANGIYATTNIELAKRIEYLNMAYAMAGALISELNIINDTQPTKTKADGTEVPVVSADAFLRADIAAKRARKLLKGTLIKAKEKWS